MKKLGFRTVPDTFRGVTAVCTSPNSRKTSASRKRFVSTAYARPYVEVARPDDVRAVSCFTTGPGRQLVTHCEHIRRHYNRTACAGQPKPWAREIPYPTIPYGSSAGMIHLLKSNSS